ncbi:Aminomethyltransferase folate-binding domain-containing protein, partial [Delitschia confertaspora ATCC 74209]
PSSPASRALVPLPHRRLLSLSGPDAPKFLQGLITHNVDPSSTESFYAAFLDARGRCLWDVFVWVQTAPGEEWRCWIEVDGEEVDTLMKHLKRHKLRSKILLGVVDAERMSPMGVWACWDDSGDHNPKADSWLRKLQDSSRALSLMDPRAESMGMRILALDPSTFNNTAHDLLEFLPDTRQYHLRRYLLGIPEGPVEIPRESALPMECNIDLSNGIDFRKGCYVGQELTIRTKHTGVVRKRILPVQLYSENETIPEGQKAPVILAGAEIKQLDESGSVKKGRSAGKLIGNVGNVGLALCRLEMMTDMRVSAEGGSWKPGMEFSVKTGDEKNGVNDGLLKVRPFVSEWFKERERALWEKGRAK